MKKLNKMIPVIFIVSLCMAVLVSCGQKKDTSSENNENTSGKLKVVATIFPEYDFLRQIAGDNIDLTMLLTPGAESHSYEPTPKDIQAVHDADMFVYVGGDSDAWVDSILDSVDKKSMNIITLMDCVDTVEEETVEGMTPEEEESESDSDDIEYDEHVWTSPANAILIVRKLGAALCEADPDKADTYKTNMNNYIKKLTKLDQQFKDVVNNAKRREIVVADRFPFRYFADEYGLKYYAAFPGCSTGTDVSADTLSFLIDKVKEDDIPVVFHIELSSQKVCDTVCEMTGAKSELLNAVHNVSQADFKAGVTYIELMEHNVNVLKEALN